MAIYNRFLEKSRSKAPWAAGTGCPACSPCYEVTFVKHQFSYNSQSPAAPGGTRKEPDTNYGLNHPAILGLGTNRLTVLAVGSMIYGRESTD